MAWLLVCGAWLSAASTWAQEPAPGVAAMMGTQSIADFLLEGANPGKNAANRNANPNNTNPATMAAAAGMSPLSPMSPLPPELGGPITPLNAGLSRTFSSYNAPLSLVGIYGTKGKAIAEFNIEGSVRYMEVDDRLKDGWVIARIAANSVDISRCPEKKPCQTRTLHLEAQ